VIPTTSGPFVKPENAVLADPALAGLLNDYDLRLVFPGTEDLSLVDPSLQSEGLPHTIRPLVRSLSLGQVARTKPLLQTKLHEPDNMNWFVRFYTALALSGSQFRTVQARDARGRIVQNDWPIFLISDKDDVVLAQHVYFRDIPNKVLDLRARFPEVEAVLSAYQHIHPDLSTPELVLFFKQQTHVGSVDYEKICTDIFLPRVMVGSPPPRGDEVLAYTLLLQEGPPVYEPIWVTTKTGNLKHSNQVFFGSEYLPAENWESQNQYCCQIDFLSAAYLGGGREPDISAWKQFFLRVGVKEHAENPYVRDFAVSFVKEKLSTELDNFVSKEHQQHGYDLEAKMLSDGTIVCLEVKGQKKEAQVELIGNEPKASQEARLKGQGFWVCIVPGIPEYPQLWIVNDPLTCGEYKTLTLDVSRWKAFGRRLV